jgi:solute carrier family 25 protein 34/35
LRRTNPGIISQSVWRIDGHFAMDRRDIFLSVSTSAAAPALSALVTNPADVAKTRLNMDRELLPPTAVPRYRGVMDCLRSIGQAEGIAGLQRGLSFVLVREASKNAFRLGLYEPAVAVLDGPPRPGKRVAPMSTRVAAGALTGALAALICNPLDLLKTRLQAAEGSRDASALRHLQQLYTQEGALALWRRGVMANMSRSAIATGVALPVNARLKELCAGLPLLSGRPTLRDTLCALGSAAATTFAINPLDLIRTRLYAQPAEGSLYRGVLHCAWRVGSTEGLLAFWKGSSANFLRIGPHQTLTFVIIGLMRRMLE